MDGQNPVNVHINQDEPRSFVDKAIEFVELNLSRIIIGVILFVIVIFVLIGILFFVNRARTNSSVVPTPTPTQSQLGSTQVTPSEEQPNQTKQYEDSVYSYTISIPKNYETYKRAGNETAYQTGIKQEGASDASIVINTQPSNGIGLDDYIQSVYGAGIQTESAKIGQYDGVKAVIPATGVISYFLTQNGNIYEFSSANNSQTLPIFNLILSSFRFK